MIVIAISGRAGCGKDTLFGFLEQSDQLVTKEKFAYPLQQIVALLGQFRYHRNQFEDRAWKESRCIDLSWLKRDRLLRQNIYQQIANLVCGQAIHANSRDRYLSTPDGTRVTWSVIYAALLLQFENLLPATAYSPRQLMQILGTDLFRQHVHPDIWIASAHERLLSCPPNSVVIFTDLRFPNELKLLKRWGGRLVYLERPNLESKAPSHASESNYDYLKAEADIVFDNSGPLERLQDFAWQLKETFRVQIPV